MRLKIYQINSERDKNRVKFQSLDSLKKLQPDETIDPSLYDEVLDAEIDETGLEGIFRRFNSEGHPLFRGHSLSVSDVVVIEQGNSMTAVGEITIREGGIVTQTQRFAELADYNARIAELTESGEDFEARDMAGLCIPMKDMPKPGAYFCDSIGFKPIAFDEALTENPDDLMRIVYVEPHRAPYASMIPNTLEAKQKAVGDGLIEVTYNGDGTCLISNDESKLIGMDGNRRIWDGNGIIAGPFFVCGDAGEEFRGLTDEEVMRYMDRFAEVEDISTEEVEADMGFTIYTIN